MLKELKEAKSIDEANELLSSGEWVCISQHVINNNITYILGRYDFSGLKTIDNISNRKGKKYSISELPRKRFQ